MAMKKKATRKSAPKKPAARRAVKQVARKAARKKEPQKSASRKPAAGKAVAAKSQTARPDVPNLFRINLEVGNLDEAIRFYTELLGTPGRRQAGSRVYFDVGPVTLQVVDVASMGMGVPHPAAKALYFTVRDLDALFKRAEALGCLSREMIHGTRGGAIAVRPWGERSFYVEDRWLNPLCFVEAGTIYPG